MLSFFLLKKHERMSMEKRTDEEKKALVKAWQESGKK
jgi:hypothetical protein